MYHCLLQFQRKDLKHFSFLVSGAESVYQVATQLQKRVSLRSLQQKTNLIHDIQYKDVIDYKSKTLESFRGLLTDVTIKVMVQ